VAVQNLDCRDQQSLHVIETRLGLFKVPQVAILPLPVPTVQLRALPVSSISTMSTAAPSSSAKASTKTKKPAQPKKTSSTKPAKTTSHPSWKDIIKVCHPFQALILYLSLPLGMHYRQPRRRTTRCISLNNQEGSFSHNALPLLVLIHSISMLKINTNLTLPAPTSTSSTAPSLTARRRVLSSYLKGLLAK
jgi:hypothetical protein